MSACPRVEVLRQAIHGVMPMLDAAERVVSLLDGKGACSTVDALRNAVERASQPLSDDECPDCQHRECSRCEVTP